MEKKDPAALFYIDTWLTSTAEMDSDVRGWYLNLILHQYNKKDLPNDIEKLAVLAGVKYSEFEKFKQVYKQVLEQKFKQNSLGRLENDFASSIIKSREQFKEKRTKSGIIGAVIKKAQNIEGFNEKYINILKNELKNMPIEEIEKHMDKQMLKHLLKLYINININKDINNNEDKTEFEKESEPKDPIIPSYENFEHYAIENKPNVCLSDLKLKYNAWVANGWKDGKGQKITNWKSKLLQTLPHIRENPIKTETKQPHDPNKYAERLNQLNNAG